MYLIDIKINEETANSTEAEQLLSAHQAWFSKYFEQGNFLLLGPYKDIANAGLIIAQADSREALAQILSEDVYYPNKAAYQVNEFVANKIQANITEFAGQ